MCDDSVAELVGKEHCFIVIVNSEDVGKEMFRLCGALMFVDLYYFNDMGDNIIKGVGCFSIFWIRGVIFAQRSEKFTKHLAVAVDF